MCLGRQMLEGFRKYMREPYIRREKVGKLVLLCRAELGKGTKRERERERDTHTHKRIRGWYHWGEIGRYLAGLMTDNLVP